MLRALLTLSLLLPLPAFAAKGGKAAKAPKPSQGFENPIVAREGFENPIVARDASITAFENPIIARLGLTRAEHRHLISARLTTVGALSQAAPLQAAGLTAARATAISAAARRMTQPPRRR